MQAQKRLLAAIVFFEITHLLGMAAMVFLLLPGISPHLSIDERAAYVRNHAGAWRIGWFAWQASALSDVWLTAELFIRSRAHGHRTAQRWMTAAALLLVLAIVPDQYAEARLVSDFITVEGRAWVESFATYMRLSGTWACLAYTLMALCWLRAARRGERLHWPELSMVGSFFGAATANYVAFLGDRGNTTAFNCAVVLNGYAFVVLLVQVGTLATRRRL